MLKKNPESQPPFKAGMLKMWKLPLATSEAVIQKRAVNFIIRVSALAGTEPEYQIRCRW